MCSSNFYSFPYNCLIDNLTNELCGYTFICGKSGKHQTLTILSKENSNNFLIKGRSHNYSRVLSGVPQCERRYSVKTVKNQNGKRKMKKKYRTSKYLETKGCARHRPVSLLNLSSSSILHVLENRPLPQKERYLFSILSSSYSF